MYMYYPDEFIWHIRCIVQSFLDHHYFLFTRCMLYWYSVHLCIAKTNNIKSYLMSFFLQLAMILRNLSFERANMQALPSSTIVLRYLHYYNAYNLQKVITWHTTFKLQHAYLKNRWKKFAYVPKVVSFILRGHYPCVNVAVTFCFQISYAVHS